MNHLVRLLRIRHAAVCTIFLVCLTAAGLPVHAQRQTEAMDRAVIAMKKGATSLYVSWRYLVDDPEDIAFNVYAGSVRLNSTPITNSTNLLASYSTASDLSVYVKPVINGVEGAASTPFAYKASTGQHRIVRDFNFQPIPGETTYEMKFCWPADLDGNGRYDFVLDRQAYGASSYDAESEASSGKYPTPKVEAYSSEGVFLWRIDMGPNVKICSGHSDMVVAYDMDGDGKAEVLMKTSEGTTFADGTVITDTQGHVTDTRDTQTVPPHYISVVNGLTGCEITRIEMPNKSYREKDGLYNSWDYRNHNGHFGIAYLDGVRPSLVFEYSNRNADKSFNNFVTAWDYRNGVLSERFNWVNPGGIYNDFHQIRIADVDGDGMDEMIEGGFVVDHDGTPLFGTDLCHGDRHRTTDIDPDRPGLETFAIQQNNSTTLGMALYDAATGQMIKRWYMNGVGDVGRGDCLDMDETSRGLEMYSTMYGYYNAKGELLVDSSTDFPAEPIWWDGDLLREVLTPIGSSGANLDIKKWNSSTKTMNRLMYNGKPLYNEKSNYYTRAQYGGRPGFIGDILGDWREELVLERSDHSGFCILSTWEVTDHRIYCLMQNPAYRMQATTKGYYQSPYTDYYLAYDMPDPPVPPVMQADAYWNSADAVWNGSNQPFADWKTGAAAGSAAKEVMFDLRGVTGSKATVTLEGTLTPKKLWLITPKGKDYVFIGTGKLSGSMPVVKSQQGTVTLYGNHDYTGQTRIAEGRLLVNGSLTSQVRVQARGVIGGTARLSGGLLLEEGLNTEGGRLEPGMGSGASELGSLVIDGSVQAKGRNTFAFDIVPGSARVNDSIVVNGDLTITGNNNTLVINYPGTSLQAGTYALIRATGTLHATADQFSVQGLDGTPNEVFVENNMLKLRIEESRLPGEVYWKGDKSNVWDFKTKNFRRGQSETVFAPSDTVILSQDAQNKTILLNNILPVSAVICDGTSDFSVSGSGSWSGTGELLKYGPGTLKISGARHTYTGKTVVQGGVLEIDRLSVAGDASSIGAAPAAAGNFRVQDATLRVMGESVTDRTVTVDGVVTMDIPTSTVYVNLRGPVQGSGRLVKTGAGQLTLSAANSHTGGTVVKEGTVLLGTYEANMGAFPNGVILENATLNMFDINEMSKTGPAAWNIEVPEGSEATLSVPSRFSMTGALTGGGILHVRIPYVRAEMQGDWSAFTGTIQVGGSQGEFRLRNSRGFAGATVDLASNATLHYPTSAPSSAVPIGMLTGVEGAALKAASSGTMTWAIGGNNANGVFAGTISGSSNIVKQGSGSLTLSGDNTYTGTTTVSAGRLVVTNTAGSATSSGAVTVAAGAVLAGTGTVAGAATVNGTVQPGVDGVGTLSFGGALTLTSSAVMDMQVRKNPSSSSDRIRVTGQLIWNGTLQLTPVTGAFAVGDEFTVVSAGSISGVPTQILPQVPVEGGIWDMSSLSSGIIRVITDPDALAVIVTQPVAPANVLCNGEQATLSVVASGPSLTYQWYRNNVAVQDAVQSSYVVKTAGEYSVSVSSPHNTVRSTAVTVRVAEYPQILKQPVAASTYAGHPAQLSVETDITPTSYIWYRNGTRVSDQAVWSVEQEGTYYVEVFNQRCKTKSEEAFVKKLGPTPSAADLWQTNAVYPNPVKDVLYIAVEDAVERIEQVDISGQILRVLEAPSAGMLEWRMDSWPSGIYFIRMISSDQVSVYRILKE